MQQALMAADSITMKGKRCTWLVRGMFSCTFQLYLVLLSIQQDSSQTVTIPVFAPLTCSEDYTNYSETIVRATEMYEGQLSFTLAPKLINSCDVVQMLSLFPSVVQNLSIPVIIGPAAYHVCSISHDITSKHEKVQVSWWCGVEPYRTESVLSVHLGTPNRAAGQALARFLFHFKWKFITIFAVRESEWYDMAKDVALELSVRGFDVRDLRIVADEQNTTRLEELVQASSEHSTAMVLCMPVADTRRLLLACAGVFSTGDHAIFIMHTTSAFHPVQYLSHLLNSGGATQQEVSTLQDVLKAVFVVSAHSRGYHDVVSKTHSDTGVIDSNLFDAISLTYNAFNHTSYSGSQNVPNGTLLYRAMLNTTFPGYYGPVYMHSDGWRTSYVISWDYKPESNTLYGVLETSVPGSDAVTVLDEVHWPGGTPPPDDACHFDGATCIIGLSAGYVAMIVVLVAGLIAAIILVACLIRRYMLRQDMTKGPHKLILTSADLVFSSGRSYSRSTRSPRSAAGLSLDKPDILKASQPSLSISSAHEYGEFHIGETARLNGDIVYLKELQIKGFELKNKVVVYLRTLRELRHENINPVIAFLNDSMKQALVVEFCSRRSLEDVINNEDIKLDWSFKLSLLTDLVRGMRYLQSSAVKVHGFLKSGNCVIDSRWVLKITDYGVSGLYQRCQAHRELPPKELLWTAPELLRDPALTRNSPKADVFSFAIIMQEVILRGHPYCMLELEPEEIIKKIRKPPPLCRPSVSQQAAPPEYIQTMKQCWAEMPDMRPDFDQLHHQFKELNRGKKMNIVDTMFKMLEKYSNDLEDIVRERTGQLEEEKKKTEQLLTRMLPRSVADNLKVGQAVEPETYDQVTIYFSDIVGFTTISAMSNPMQVIDLLNSLYTLFDACIETYDVYKVETIGDAYMVVSGLPERNGNRHAGEVGTMALDLLSQCGSFKIPHLPDIPLRLRIGLHTGSCAAGVVGLTMPRYCLFGDTVNTASRMESTGLAQRIHISLQTKETLDELGGYFVEFRGEVELKGKGLHRTYWLTGKEGFTKPLPDAPDSLGLSAYLPSPASGTNLQALVKEMVARQTQNQRKTEDISKLSPNRQPERTVTEQNSAVSKSPTQMSNSTSDLPVNGAKQTKTRKVSPSSLVLEESISQSAIS